MTKIVSKFLSISLVALLILASSCSSNLSVSKRYHSRGFNFAWGSGSASSMKPAVKKAKPRNSGVVVNNNQAFVQGKTPTLEVPAPLARSFGLGSNPTEKTSINVREGLVSTTLPSHVEIKSTSSFVNVPTETKKIQKNPGKSNPKVLKEKKMEPIFGTDKSQIVALLLCLFLGTLGIHRFYLGYPVAGVIQLLILGTAIRYKLKLVVFFALLWLLIDLIRIFLGDLQPRNGSYYDSF